MTKLVCVQLLLGGLLLAGCGRKEASMEATPSPPPAKPAASVSVSAAPAEQPAPPPASPAETANATPGESVKLPPFIVADSTPAASIAEGAPAKARAAAANPANLLAALNKGLRNYMAKNQQKLPGSIDDLAAAGFIDSVPAAPAGMAYIIDTARREVVLKKQ